MTFVAQNQRALDDAKLVLFQHGINVNRISSPRRLTTSETGTGKRYYVPQDVSLEARKELMEIFGITIEE